MKKKNPSCASLLPYLFVLVTLLSCKAQQNTDPSKGNTMTHMNGIVRDGEFDIPDLATLPPDGGPNYNRLIFTSSPYLLQHARNPVDWYPWGDEAFKKAKQEDKPIFLSIGYSTCHWCHVMEHESFEDAELASYLNEYYVAIKVDREERPDVDAIYMAVCQTMTGSGGWPLTIFMTPDRKPFFAGTYYPKNDRFGKPGFMRVLSTLADAWKNERTKITNIGEEIREHLLAANEREGGDLPASVLDQAVMNFSRSYDPANGGFGSAPKFPMGHTLSFLLRRYHISKDPAVLRMVEHTLVSMHRGGLYDHIGFAFCRYSTDSTWLVPHFEKMLYDNALLLMAYADAYQVTGKKEYKEIGEEIVTYILRDMTDKHGAFYSAENADSEGEEGKFYVFTYDEFLSVVGKAHGKAMAEYFGVEESGNFEHGRNILHITPDPNEWRKRYNLDEKKASSIISEARKNLFHYRAHRIHPSLDDKILTSWNGLVIAALSRAGQAFSDDAMILAARKAADFLLRAMVTKDDRLLHRYRNGTAGIGGFLEDYAYLVWGLIDLYQATFDVRYLRSAVSLNESMIHDFADDKTGGFYFSAHDAEELLIRTKDGYDGALPSGNSVAAYNHIRLAHITGSPTLEEYANRTLHAFSRQVKSDPTGFTLLLTALDYAMEPSREIVLSGKDVSAVKEMASFVRSVYLPRAVMLFHPDGEAGMELESLSSYVKDNTSIDGRPTAYVCENYVCQLPVTDTGALKRLIIE